MNNRVLIVEDHHDTSFALCKLLKVEGYEVDHAIDGLAGYKTAKDNHPDLVVTDVQMPRLNGIELIKLIREDHELHDTPVLVMSAFGQRVIDDALAAGASAYIEKPLDMTKFLTTVKSMLPPTSAATTV